MAEMVYYSDKTKSLVLVHCEYKMQHSTLHITASQELVLVPFNYILVHCSYKTQD